jgi:Family of unknown function (DUF6788)
MVNEESWKGRPSMVRHNTHKYIYLRVRLVSWLAMCPQRPNKLKLDDYHSRILECKEQLQDIDFVIRGSIIKHSVRCGTKGCRCHANPPVLHGPYYDWTRKVQGKTKTVRLSEEEAEILQEWIDNVRKVEKIISEMVEISMEAVEIIRG